VARVGEQGKAVGPDARCHFDCHDHDGQAGGKRKRPPLAGWGSSLGYGVFVMHGGGKGFQSEERREVQGLTHL